MKILKGYTYCPICDGEGEFKGKECEFCDGYGFLKLLDEETSYDEDVEDYDSIEYTTYLTYLRGKRKHFKHSTNEIVIEAGESFFDCEGIPPENQYIPIIPD